MKNLMQEYEEYKSINYTGVEAIDILLQYKKNMARLSHIKMNIIGEKVDLKIPEYELVALLGNLIDNAIEASKQMDDEKRTIQIIIRKIRGMSFIKIINFYKKEPCSVNGKLISYKQDGRMHGIGLRSAKGIVEKYNGTIDCCYKNGKFFVLIVFF